MQRETEKALRQIPKELAKLNKIIVAIGQAMAGKKASELAKTKKEFDNEMQEKPGVT